MTNVTIPTGQSRDGWIWVCVNGQQQWIKAGEATELDASEIELLTNAGLSFSEAADDFTPPESAVLYADFTQGHFHDGTSSVAGNTLFGNDAYFTSTLSDPDLGANGWSPATRKSLGLIDISQVIEGATFVFDVITNGQSSPDAYFSIEALDRFNFNIDFIFSMGSDTWVSPDGSSTLAYHTPHTLAAGVHRAAVTIMDGKIAASIDGGAVFQNLTAWPEGEQPVVVGVTIQPSATPTTALKKLVMYPAVSNAELITLSAL